ncbi:hypothetical protein [Sphingobacterium sp.]|uniref:hypothetical protein n=1 Tax=Sphingobacterium sp. TaxID=341027 RepID=UPI0031CE21AD
MLYNPFTPVTKDSFRELVESGYNHFVLQRFEWPGVKGKSGFLLTPYDEQRQAEIHAHYLNVKEGKVIQMPEDAEKLEALLTAGSGYRIFLNQIREDKWDKRMLKIYDKNIINYLRTKTKFHRKNPIDIFFSLENGRVVALITDGHSKKKVLAIEILR